MQNLADTNRHKQYIGIIELSQTISGSSWFPTGKAILTQEKDGMGNPTIAGLLLSAKTEQRDVENLISVSPTSQC